jgi:cellulose biosynthesis protein BcsQ
MSSAQSAQRTEVIVFCSGKGGTGKTSLISALGYALRTSGHRVLFVDADRATDGLSLFVLGPEGREQLASFSAESTFTGLLERFEKGGQMQPQPHTIHRTRDHGLSYDVIISDRYLYGDAPDSERPTGASIDRQFERRAFQQAVQAFFESIRASGDYDYVLVDSRGGFSFESTDVAAAGDSFVVVTEATFTNFYQDRNLVDRIGDAATRMQRRAVLRAVIINKSTDAGEEVDAARIANGATSERGEVRHREVSYRNELVREFGIRFEDTYCVALDLEALRAYKEQKSVFKVAPASRFAYDALQAFQRILQVVTSQWADDRIARWDQLIAQIDAAIQKNNEEADAITRAREQERHRVLEMESELGRLRAELERAQAARAQEQKRQDLLLAEFRNQEAMREQRFAREMTEAQTRFEKEAAARTELELLKVRHEAELRAKSARSANVLQTLLSAALALIAIAAVWIYLSKSRDGGPGTAYPVAPAAVSVQAASAPVASAAPPREAPTTSADGPVTNALIAAPASDGKWLRPCLAGTYNVIVASGFRDTKAAETLRAAYASDHPEFEFQVVSTVSERGSSDVMQAIFAGQGLSRAEASDLLSAIRKADFISNAYITPQTFDCAGSKAQAARSLRLRKAMPKASDAYGAKY